MKKTTIAILPVDLNNMQTPAYNTIKVKYAIKIVVHFLALVAAFAVMFGYFVLASTVPEPKPATEKLIYERGENAYESTSNTVSPRI